MLHKFTKIILLFTIICFISCANNNEEILPIEAAQYLDKNYGNDNKQTYDIYLPEGRNKATPVIIVVHGGFWSSGDKNDMNPFVTTARNSTPKYAIVNTNYRLANNTRNQHPTQINDLSLLISELKSKQEEYQISDNYFFIGYSAGGHLALLYSYLTDTNNDVKAVCSFAGPTDFLDPSYTNSQNEQFQNVAENFLGDTYPNNPSLYENASPITHVKANTTPTILFYGGRDNLIPTSQGQRLYDKLNDTNIMAEFNLYPNVDHNLTGLDLNEAATKVKLFFDQFK